MPDKVTKARDSLSEHVLRNVQAITEIHLAAERTINAHQRAIESVTALLGRPATLYAIVASVIAWTAGNAICSPLGLRAPDPPPFPWLQGLISLSALLMSTM